MDGPDMGSWKLLPAMASIALLAGCGSPNIAQFASGTPSMAPDKWMLGTVDGYGLIVDRFGSVQGQFHAHEVGDWNAATQTMTVTEHITYLQGSTTPPSDRVWKFVQTSPGHWTGTAADVIGTAVGEQLGNAWHLKFSQNLPVGGQEVEVAVEDWRWRESDTVALDQSTITKLGLTLATGEIAFVKSN
jgi:hypothetical protein